MVLEDKRRMGMGGLEGSSWAGNLLGKKTQLCLGFDFLTFPLLGLIIKLGLGNGPGY